MRLQRLRVVLVAGISIGCLLCSQAVPVLADDLSPEDIDAIYNNWPGWVAGDNAVCGGVDTGRVTVIVGSDRQQAAFTYFVTQRGLGKIQAAAIVGNLMQESNIKPEDGRTTNALGKGIAQWSKPGRWDALVSWASRQPDGKGGTGRDPWALATQLDYMWEELTNVSPWKNTLAPLKAATNIGDATKVFMDMYEIPRADVAFLNHRITYAQQTLKLYGGGVVVTDQASAIGSGGDATLCPNSGAGSEFLDGFVFYDQCNPDWGNYASTTVCEGGCGPSSMAMIITNLTGVSVTPHVAASYAANHGQYIPGTGSAWTIAPVLAAHWNLHAKLIGNDLGKINAALQNGQLVAAPGNGPVPYTKGGHYIVIRALTADGKWKIADPDHERTHRDDNTTTFNPKDILPYMHPGGVYAISR